MIVKHQYKLEYLILINFNKDIKVNVIKKLNKNYKIKIVMNLKNLNNFKINT